MNTPLVRIQYSWLLAEGASKALELQATGKADDNIPHEEYQAKTTEYRSAWAAYQAKILPGISEAVGLEFRRPIIDISTAPWFIPISDPVVINFRDEPDQFIDTLTHELFHVLFTDNHIMTLHDSDGSKSPLLKEWQRMFGEIDDFNMLVHIPAHAGLKYIYQDVLKQPRRLRRDIKMCQEWPSYKAAWDYVETHDYKKILAQLKGSYIGMKNTP